MLVALHEGKHFAQMSFRRFLHNVGQHSYIPKELEDSRKLGFDERQHMVHIGISPRALWEVCVENVNPQVINRNIIVIKRMEKWFHWRVSCSAGPQRESHPLTGLTAPSFLTAESTAHTLIPAPSAFSSGPFMCLLLGASVYMTIS